VRVSRSAGVTSTGRKRRRNEDAFVNEPPLFAVADGMGGPRAGEVASGLAAAAVKAGEAGGDGVERVVALIQEANRRVRSRRRFARVPRT
jgi:PPM family protein phosphatase